MSVYTDALDAHVATIRVLGDPTKGTALFGSLLHADPAEWERADVTAAAKRTSRKLDRAKTVVVTEAMLDLVLHRMGSVEFGQPLEPEDLPFESAYVLLPRPVLVPLGRGDHDDDVAPRKLASHGANAEFSAGWWVPHRVDGAEEADGLMYSQAVQRNRLPEATAILSSAVDSKSLEEGRRFLLGLGMPYVPLYLSGWQFGLSWDPQYREESYVLTDSGEFERRFWLAMWRTLREEIVAPVRLTHRAARAATRIGITPDIVVCQLRRIRRRFPNADESLPTGETVMWTHRWRVQGHARVLNRGTANERVVRVRSYVKGPADRPLIEKDRVYRLGR